MDQDSINKICRILSSSYDVVTSCFDYEGEIVFSTYAFEGNRKKYYLEAVRFAIDQCRRTQNVLISIDEISITMIGIPVNCENEQGGIIIIGPFYSNRLSDKFITDSLKRMQLEDRAKKEFLESMRNMPYYPFREYYRLTKLIYHYLYNQELEESNMSVINFSDSMERSEADNRTSNAALEIEQHETYLFERYMLECIRTGDVNKLQKILRDVSKPELMAKAGVLSIGNEMRQQKNLFIAATSIATRAAIEGGLNSEIAFSLSDIYICQVEAMKTVNPDMVEKMLVDFAGRVQEINKVEGYSPYVNQCYEYIKLHIYDDINISMIADYLGISHEYLSRLFKQETGMSVIEYLKKSKVKEAKFLLKYSKLSFVEISEKLAFCSQSHFITVFKKEVKLTPKQYRDKVKILA